MKQFQEWLKENRIEEKDVGKLNESNYLLHHDNKTNTTITHNPTEDAKIIVSKVGKTKKDNPASHNEWNNKTGMEAKTSTIPKGTHVHAHYDPVKNTTFINHFDGKFNHSTDKLHGHFSDHVE